MVLKPQAIIWIVLGSIYVPIVSAFCVVWVWNWRTRKHGGRLPLAEKLLRPAGESLRLKLDDLGEKLGTAFAFAVGVPAIALAVILLSSPDGTITTTRAIVAFVVCLVLIEFFLWRVFKLGAELRNHRLGFHGERAVAEELNQLLRDNCRVFHDVPMEPYGNIDHVVVAPSGVFAVETKTRRKANAQAGKKSHEVVFDGEALQFPNGRSDTEGLEQAQQQANRLRAFLTKAVGEAVPVAPILTLPGWFVSSRVPGKIKVLNPKGIKHVVLSSGAQKISPQLVERIAHQLDQKCRDVDF